MKRDVGPKLHFRRTLLAYFGVSHQSHRRYVCRDIDSCCLLADLPTLVNCQAGHPLPFPCPSLSYPPPTQSQPYLYHSPPALPLPTLLLSHIRLLSPIPSLPYPSLDPVQLCGLWEHCKFPQRVRAEPGRQTHFGATAEAKTGHDTVAFKIRCVGVIFVTICNKITLVHGSSLLTWYLI